MGVWWERWGSHHRSKLPLGDSVPNTGQGWRGPVLLGVPQPGQTYAGETENM